jgi:hypothetical protein
VLAKNFGAGIPPKESGQIYNRAASLTGRRSSRSSSNGPAILQPQNRLKTSLVQRGSAGAKSQQ